MFHHHLRKTWAAAGIAAVATTALTACGAPDDAGSGGSGSSDSLNIACSQQEDFCQIITAAFEDATGIDATYVRLGSGEVLARLQTNPGEFDVWSGGQAENHLLADDDGYIEAYQSPEANGLPETLNDPDGLWSGFYTDSVAFCSSQTRLDELGLEAPTSWDDLLASDLQDEVSMPHPATAGVGYMAMYTIDVLEGGDEDATLDYFRDLNPNIMQYARSAATGTEQAGRGEVAVAIALDADCEKAKQAGFDDLVTSYPEEGTGYEVGAVSVLSDARNTEAAQEYMDWILTTEAQNLYADVPSFAAPTNPDAEIGENVPRQDTVEQVDWDLRDAAGSRDEYVQLFESEIASADEAG